MNRDLTSQEILDYLNHPLSKDLADKRPRIEKWDFWIIELTDPFTQTKNTYIQFLNKDIRLVGTRDNYTNLKV